MSDAPCLPGLVSFPRVEVLDPGGPAQRLLSAFLAGRSPQTLRAYRADLADFAAFAGVGSLAEAAQRLLAQGHGAANELALRYQARLRERGLASATTNRRLAALPGNVEIPAAISGLPEESVANVTQLATIDRRALEPEPLGALPAWLMATRTAAAPKMTADHSLEPLAYAGSTTKAKAPPIEAMISEPGTMTASTTSSRPAKAM